MIKILIIAFLIILLIIKLWTNYIRNDFFASIKYQVKGNLLLGILYLTEYIIGAVIIVMIVFRFIK